MRSWTPPLVLALGGIVAAAGPSASIDAGTVNGDTCEGTSEAVYYKGIPFAQPPVKALRFAPPKAYDQKYDGGSLDATKPPPACIQFAEEFKESGPTDEDCLYLNVWAPANATKGSNLPVRVWIYGGANSDGGISNPLYDGCNVASTGAVMVSINYRLGPLGFMSLKSAGFGGNQGIQDALLGLQWVQDNIAAFGGNPEKVLLHGQSAGAQDSWYIATLPQAKKLISAAIFESGAGGTVQLQPAVDQLGQSYAQHLNCSSSDGKSVNDLTSTYSTLPALNTKKFPAVGIYNLNGADFGPCVDGDVIPKQPIEQGAQVPSVFGSNTREGTLFALGQFATSPNGPAGVTSADYDQFLQENFGSQGAALVKQYYPVSAFNSTPFPAFFAISEVVTAASFECPARRGVEAATAAGVPAWSYIFAHSPKCIWIPGIPQEAVPILGATHTAEIPFVFGHTSNLPSPNGTCEMTDVEKNISSFMLGAWTSMAANQKPTADDSDWPAWTDAQKSQGLNIVNSTQPGYLNYTGCELWDKIDALVHAGNATGGTGMGGTGMGGNGTSGYGTGASSTGNGSASGSSSSAPGSPSSPPQMAANAASVKVADLPSLALCAAFALLILY